MANKIRIQFLGTADQTPSIKRNHSAILLTFNEENILVDCGEGTQRQFRYARWNPCKVTRILITHWHGDHVFGLPGLLSTLSLSGYNKTLYIYGPQGTKNSIKELLRVFNFQKNYEIKVEDVVGKFFEAKDFYLEAEVMQHGTPCNAYNFVKKGHVRIDKLKLKKLKIPEGRHLQELKEGKDIVYESKKVKAKDVTFKDDEVKISFVLDTKLNAKIVPFVRDADLFVSESTFSKDLDGQAQEYKHMTAEQVGKIAKDAKVKDLILTHLSQRYENEHKKIINEAKKNFKKIKVANDLDIVEI